MAVAPAAAERPWFKKKRVLIPTGAFVGLMTLGALLPTPEEDDVEAVAETTPDEEVAGPIVESTTTTAAKTTTTEAPTTTSTTAPTTTLSEAEVEEMVRDELGPFIVRDTMDDPRVNALSDEEIADFGQSLCELAGQVETKEAFALLALLAIPADTDEPDEFWFELIGATLGVYCGEEAARIGLF